MRDETLKEAGLDPSARMTSNELLDIYLVAGSRAEAIWHSLVPHASAIGGWPVILGDPDEKNYLDEMHAGHTPAAAQQILSEVPWGPPVDARIRADVVMRKRMLEHFEKMGQDVPEILRSHLAAMSEERPSPGCPPTSPSFLDWCRSAPPSARTLHSVRHLRGKFLKQCMFSIVRCNHPADVPAVLGFGGYNDCPPPTVHVAFMRDWYSRFGAVPICVTHDVIELCVSRPPATAEETWQAAWEMVKYCDDIVSQGTQTMEGLAQEIWKSNYWFFWWD